MALTLAGVYMDVLFNDWYNLFYNTLQDKNKPEFYRQILRFSVLAGVWIVMMAAMMFPSVAPTVALYAQMTEQRALFPVITDACRNIGPM